MAQHAAATPVGTPVQFRLKSELEFISTYTLPCCREGIRRNFELVHSVAAHLGRLPDMLSPEDFIGEGCENHFLLCVCVCTCFWVWFSGRHIFKCVCVCARVCVDGGRRVGVAFCSMAAPLGRLLGRLPPKYCIGEGA